MHIFHNCVEDKYTCKLTASLYNSAITTFINGIQLSVILEYFECVVGEIIYLRNLLIK